MAAQTLGIKNLPDYTKRYREDPRLPSCPDKIYADAGWMDWYDFLGNERPGHLRDLRRGPGGSPGAGIKRNHDYKALPRRPAAAVLPR